MGGTPEYDWDTRYDGISGFPSRLRNRVSEPSTPQRGQSPRGDLKHPLNHKDIINSLKYMMRPQRVDLCPPYNRLDQLIYAKSLRKRVLKHHVTFVVTLGMTIENCTKEAYLESQDVRLDPEMGRTPQGQCPNCDVPHPGICPCAWCDQLGHIAQDCIAHFADSSMQARFPKERKSTMDAPKTL